MKRKVTRKEEFESGVVYKPLRDNICYKIVLPFSTCEVYHDEIFLIWQKRVGTIILL